MQQVFAHLSLVEVKFFGLGFCKNNQQTVRKHSHHVTAVMSSSGGTLDETKMDWATNPERWRCGHLEVVPVGSDTVSTGGPLVKWFMWPKFC